MAIVAVRSPEIAPVPECGAGGGKPHDKSVPVPAQSGIKWIVPDGKVTGEGIAGHEDAVPGPADPVPVVVLSSPQVGREDNLAPGGVELHHKGVTGTGPARLVGIDRRKVGIVHIPGNIGAEILVESDPPPFPVEAPDKGGIDQGGSRGPELGQKGAPAALPAGLVGIGRGEVSRAGRAGKVGRTRRVHRHPPSFVVRRAAEISRVVKGASRRSEPGQEERPVARVIRHIGVKGGEIVGVGLAADIGLRTVRRHPHPVIDPAAAQIG